VPIYQDAGVSDADAASTAANINNVFVNTDEPKLATDDKNKLEGKLKEIRVVANTSGDYSGYFEYQIDNEKVILKIQAGLIESNIKICFEYLVSQDDFKALAAAPARNGIRLASGNGVPAKRSVAPVAQFGRRKTFHIQNRIAMSRIKSSRQYC
jgi:hypothetical protein